jgi:hypothetical protein
MKNPLFYYTYSPVTYSCAADMNVGPLSKCHSAVINSPESYSGGRKFNSSTQMLGHYLTIDHTCLLLHSFQFIVHSHTLT